MAAGGQTDDVRIVVAGKTGNGKSATCNTILGRHMFNTGRMSQSTTRELQFERVVISEKRLMVVDTPGFFDTERSEEEVIDQVIRSLIVTHPGPHALLYVLRVDVRYTEEEFNAYIRLKKAYGENVTSHIIVALTHGDVLEAENHSVNDFISQANKELNNVLHECDYRYILFNNKRPGNEADRLIDMIQNLGRGPFEGRPYSRSAQETVNEEIRRLLRDAQEEELKNNLYVSDLKSDKERARHELEELRKEVVKGRQTRIVSTVAGAVAGAGLAAVAAPATVPAAIAATAVGGDVGHIVGELISNRREQKESNRREQKESNRREQKESNQREQKQRNNGDGRCRACQGEDTAEETRHHFQN